MQKQTKKLIAPIAIALWFIGGCMGTLAIWLLVPLPWWAKALLCLVPIAFVGLMVFVLIERIEEIRSGEEDDLSHY